MKETGPSHLSGTDQLIDLDLCLAHLPDQMAWAKPAVEQSTRLQRLMRGDVRGALGLETEPSARCGAVAQLSDDSHTRVKAVAGALMHRAALTRLVDRRAIAALVDLMTQDSWDDILRQTAERDHNPPQENSVLTPEVILGAGALAEAAWRRAQSSVDQRWLTHRFGQAAQGGLTQANGSSAFDMALDHVLPDQPDTIAKGKDAPA